MKTAWKLVVLLAITCAAHGCTCCNGGCPWGAATPPPAATYAPPPAIGAYTAPPPAIGTARAPAVTTQ